MVESGRSYKFTAYSASRGLNLKKCKELLAPVPCTPHEQHCLICELSEEQTLYLFRFGAAVFFNVPEERARECLQTLDISAEKHQREDPAELRQMFSDDLILCLGEGPVKVTFDSVTVPELNSDLLFLIARVLAQSSALDLLEWEVSSFLEQAEKRIRPLRKAGGVGSGRRRLLQFLGAGLTTRYRIVRHLSLLRTPDLTWDDEELYRCYTALVDNFEIEERIETVERMIGLASDAAEFLLQVADTRRSELLEIIIILLIAVEIVQSLMH